MAGKPNPYQTIRDMSKMLAMKGTINTIPRTTDSHAWNCYIENLYNPWEGIGAKIPMGWPTKTSTVSKSVSYQLNVAPGGTSISLGTSTINNMVAQSPITVMFQPTLGFDVNANLNYSVNYGAFTYLTTAGINPCGTSNGWSSNYQAYRLVSAGIKTSYLGAPLYKKGSISYNVTNGRTNTEYTTLTQIMSDPDCVNRPIDHPMTIVYTPQDDSCLEFVAINTAPAINQDWIGYITLNGYDSVNGFTLILDTIINYEVVPTAGFEQISGSSINEGGEKRTIPDIPAIIDNLIPKNKDGGNMNGKDLAEAMKKAKKIWDKFSKEGGGKNLPNLDFLDYL